MDRSDEDLLHDLWEAYCTARDAHTRWLRSLMATGLSVQTRRLDGEYAAAEARRQHVPRGQQHAHGPPPHQGAGLMAQRCTPWVCALAHALGDRAGAQGYEWGRPYEAMRAQVATEAARYLRYLLPGAPSALVEEAAGAYLAGWDAAAREAFGLSPDA